MRICRKCGKQYGDANRICRDCGAILDDMAAEASPVEAVVVPEERVAIATQAFPDEPAAATPTPAADWSCPKCGAAVPGDFDVCWSCLTPKEGEPASDFREAVAPPDVLAEEADPGDQPPEVRLLEELQEVAQQSGCQRCGSLILMRSVTVVDKQGDAGDRELQVVVYGDPGAMLFKDRLYGKLKADICGACGHVELRVTNPRELYRHYRKAHA
jgi:hypothetical protein